MKRHTRDLGLMLARLDQRHIRLGLVVLALVLFALGAGAPQGGSAGGGG